MSVLVTYFSASGVTANAARKIAGVVNGKLFAIEPEVPYSSKDLDWMDSNSRTTLESKNPNMKVAIKNLPDLGGVTTLFVGFPVWWYTAPRIIDTFLDSLNLKGIKIVPFCTSGGTAMETCEKKNDGRPSLPDLAERHASESIHNSRSDPRLDRLFTH